MRFFVLFFLSFFAFGAWADNAIEPLLNKVTLQFNAEQWSTSKSALVNVTIDAAMSDKNLESIHGQVLEKLNRIAKGEWHLISYDRSQDKSGLESLQMVAQARLLETELAGMREKAKNLSKPGETYTIQSIQFTPSEEEIRQTQNLLRENIYQQAKQELARINKLYPEQKYYLHDVNFLSGAYPVPMAAQNVMYAKTNGAERAPLVVGDKLRINATVILAAAPDAALLKLAS